jgi:glycosyltransferase involved in cell wall biosynthesis
MVYQLSPVFMSLPGIIIAKIKRIKLYMVICDFWPHSLFSMLHFKNKFIIKAVTAMSYWHYRRADGLMGVFKGIQTRLVDLAAIDKQKTLYIPQAAETLYNKEVYDKVLAKRFDKGFNIVFAGNINPAQCFDTVIDAAVMAKKKSKTTINYIILGEGMSKKWVMDEVQKQGLADNFFFEGLKPVEEVPKYQTIADALIVALSKSPLFEYGIPAKVNSYMAAGRPIVGAMDGEAKRLINDSGCGICVDSGDAKGLADAIVKMTAIDKKKRLAMGAAGKIYNAKHFGRDYNLHRLIEFVFKGNRIPDTEYPD